MDENSPLLDSQEPPPPVLKELYKRYQRSKLEDLDFDAEVLDFDRAPLGDDLEILAPIPASHLESIFRRLVKADDSNKSITKDSSVYGHKSLPGKNLLFRATLEC